MVKLRIELVTTYKVKISYRGWWITAMIVSPKSANFLRLSINAFDELESNPDVGSSIFLY